MNRLSKIFAAIFLCSSTAAVLSAQTISGTVRNLSTGQPSVGDEVQLMRLGEGMEKEAQTTTGADGNFTLKVSAANAQHFVRVLHQGVNYDQVVTGTAPLSIVVYNAVANIPGLSGSLGIAEIESDGKSLKVTEMYAITNVSRPPVTQSRADNFEITLPPDAAFDSTKVRSGNGMWVTTQPHPVTGRTFGINFPLRPGDTLFKYTYHFPYSGSATLHLRLPYPIKNFGVMLPSSMSFKSLLPGAFQPVTMRDGRQIAQAVASPLTGEAPAFQISGAGAVPDRIKPPATASTSPAAVTPAAPPHSSASRDFKDQSGKDFWFIIAGSVTIAAVLGFVLWRAAKKVKAVPPGSDRSAPLLKALQEELFQLESERLHGSISAEEYAASRDALNQSIQRALARRKSVANG